MLRRGNKLGKESLQAVAQKSTALSGPYFLARVQFGGTKSRFAVVVSKKVSPLAVNRNKVRRAVYRALRECLTALPQPTSGIFTLSKAVLDAPYEAILLEVKRVLRVH
jgi:ribonuclease P protein component